MAKPNIVAAILSVLTTVSELLKTHRDESVEIAKLKAAHDAQVSALTEQLAGEADEDGQLEKLEPLLQDIQRLAAAAKPPSDAEIEKVDAIEPDANAGDSDDDDDDSKTGSN